jgi:hypothetical protein
MDNTQEAGDDLSYDDCCCAKKEVLECPARTIQWTLSAHVPWRKDTVFDEHRVNDKSIFKLLAQLQFIFTTFIVYS